VILIDNGSTDGSADIASKIAGTLGNLRILKSPVNLGFAGGNNLGASVADGDILVFLNVDTEVAPDWLRGFQFRFIETPKVGALQAKLLRLSDHDIFDSAGDMVDYFGHGVSIGGDWNEKDSGQYENPYEVFAARGAALAIKREVFQRVGGFDESFFLDYEDIDLCWRLRLAGYKIMYEPKSRVYHAASSRDFIDRSGTHAYHPIKNRYILMLKNYEISNLAKRMIPLLVLVTLMYIGGSFRQCNPELLKLVFKGNSWVFLNLRRIIAKRSTVQRCIRMIPDSQIQSHMIMTNITRRARFYYLAWRIGFPKASYWYASPVLKQIEASRVRTSAIQVK